MLGGRDEQRINKFPLYGRYEDNGGSESAYEKLPQAVLPLWVRHSLGNRLRNRPQGRKVVVADGA
ncbi:Uncharacterised protein [Serratia fonticola]|uniref:Uncharacterized protein n=1 Tax=Serratia fonticola TaxID=47917 RepID=A0A4U9WLL5_SERFO|nr:Uncharacterised protein [Serratia fonticola]